MWWIVFPILAGLAGIYIFMLSPTWRRADFSAFAGFDYAHRGLHDNATGRPENSLAAFAAAVEHGYGIELDVQLTADGVLVVFHDDTLSRVCGEDVRICDLTLAQVRKYRLFDTDCVIPTFDEFLETAAGRVPLIIELKTAPNRSLICPAVYERMQRYSGAWCVESFDPRMMRWFKKHARSVVRGQLSTGFHWGNDDFGRIKRFALAEMLGNMLSRPDFVARDIDYLKYPSVLLTRLMGAKLVVWTVRTPDQYAALSGCCLQIFQDFTP